LASCTSSTAFSLSPPPSLAGSSGISADARKLADYKDLKSIIAKDYGTGSSKKSLFNFKDSGIFKSFKDKGSLLSGNGKKSFDFKKPLTGGKDFGGFKKDFGGFKKDFGGFKKDFSGFKKP